MLIAKENVVVRYNGKSVSLVEGQKFDVRDFDVANKDAKGAEKHIMSKQPDKFDITESTDEGLKVNEAKKEIKYLTDQLTKSHKELEGLRKVSEEYQTKFSAAAEEIEAMKKQVLSMKKEVNNYTKEKNEFEEEIRKLRLQIGTKK